MDTGMWSSCLNAVKLPLNCPQCPAQGHIHILYTIVEGHLWGEGKGGEGRGGKRVVKQSLGHLAISRNQPVEV